MNLLLGCLFVPPLALSLLAANLLQLFLLFLRPFSKSLFLEGNRRISALWFHYLTWTLQGPLRWKYEFSQLPWKENAFVVANHQAMADIPAILAMAEKSGRLGDLKWFAKSQLKWIPGLGWGLQFLDCLFVKRNWASDKTKIEGVFSRLRQNKSPYWVISFLEGTRSSKAKIQQSQKYAERMGYFPLQHLLQPRTKGFSATLEGLGSSNQAIYLLCINYEGPPPSLLKLFFGRPETISIRAERFTEWPKDQDAQENWIRSRFQEMDQYLIQKRKS